VTKFEVLQEPIVQQLKREAVDTASNQYLLEHAAVDTARLPKDKQQQKHK